MGYNYIDLRPLIFTDEGQRTFLKIRDNAKQLLTAAGAVRCQELISAASGDSWLLLACVDRLVELGELHEVTCHPTAGQHRIFTY